MKNINIFILTWVICLSLLGLVSATNCTDYNNFKLGSDINICSSGCLYQDETDSTQYNECDSSVECLFSAWFQNGTLITSSQTMERDGTTFNYSLGNLTNAGTYTGQIYCYRDKGYMPPLYFHFTISATTISQQLGFPSIQPDELILNSAIALAEEKIIGKIKDFIFKWWLVMLFGLVVLILIVMDFKNRKLKKLAKGVLRFNEYQK